MMRVLSAAVCCLLSCAAVLGQVQQLPPGVVSPNTPQTPNPVVQAQPQGAPTGVPRTEAIPADAAKLRLTYVLQAGDQILVRVQDVEELTDRPFRVEPDGLVTLPLVGRLPAAGSTVEALEASLAQALRQFVLNPIVSITVTQFKNDPVFVIGAFRATGIFPLQGRRQLLELLTSIGGLAPNAGRRIRVTRRAEAGLIPLPNAVLSPDGKTSSVEISIASLQTNINPAEDLLLEAFDIISAERAELVYFSGGTNRTGGIELGERDSISMIQALSMMGGLAPGAKPKQAVILRPVMNSARRAVIPVDISKILKTQENDFPLLANDVLFVPTSSRFRQAILGQAGAIGGAVITSIIIFSLRR